ncbi:AsmA family protein [Flavobacterium sp. RHBU_3]|uniref:AsmA family protein n=1 Tax=Flavobacterium sp. RHBU_3 TaxID=3391184 RepID=UPI003984E2B2
MKINIKKIALKTLKWAGISIAALLLLLFLLPVLFPGKIESEVRKLANKSLVSKLDFKHTRLSFFTHFPSLTVSMEDVSLMGSAPYSNDTLVKAKEISCGINLQRLIFDNTVKVDEIYVDNAYINVQISTKGAANYNVYKSPDKEDKNEPKTANDPEEGTAIQLDKVKFENCHIVYNDRSAKILVDAHGFNYLGKGGLSEEVFDLETDANIDSIDLYYDRVPYLERKQVHADLITRINTNALSFILEKNELRINKLPLEFTGFFTILRDGYNIGIDAASKNTTLEDLFSVLPPPYLTWMENTKIQGDADLHFTFKGRYNAAVGKKPDLGVSLKVDNGAIEYKDAPASVEDLNIDLAAMLPSLDIKRLAADVKAFDFKVGEKGFFRARVNTKGFENIAVRADVKSALDLAELDAALGLPDVDLKGTLRAELVANGFFNADKKLLPKTKGNIILKDGWLKTTHYPNPIKDITFVATVDNPKGTYQDLKVAITPASFVFEGNPVFVNASIEDLTDVLYNARIKGELNVGRIYQVFKQKGMDVTGYAKADLSLKGRQSYATTGQYSKLDNKGTLLLKHIKTTSELFPKAFFINEGLFRFQNEKMWFEKFAANYGKSDFALNGYLLNTINYFIEQKGTLHGEFNLNSKLINIDEFMSLKDGENEDRKTAVVYAKEENPKMSGVVAVPKNLDVWLSANAEKVEYNGLLIQNLKGKTGISKGQMYLQGANFEIIGCKVGIDARYDDESALAANFDAHFTAKDFSVKRAYNEIPMFREMATAASKAEGIISIDYTVKGDLNGNMGPIYESLQGDGIINLRDIKVQGLKMFGALSKKTGQDGLNNPSFEGITIKSHIDNNLIHIDPFTFKVSLFRPTIKGTTSFNGLLDLRIRVGLPPMGLIGVPVTVTGTHNDPKIKVFSKTGKTIDEAIYNEKTNTVVREEKVKKAK